MKKGFTLIELLVVIALLAIVSIYAVPNIMKLFKDTKTNLNDIQKKQLSDAFKLYLNDTCLNKINTSYVCEFSETLGDNNKALYSGTMTLDAFVSKGYFTSSTIATNCTGDIIVTDNVIDVSDITCEL